MLGESGLIGVALGMGLGARHALEPDHLAAVSVLAADCPGARRGLLVGALWGVGHTLSLLACGLAVSIAAAQIPAGLTELFEIAVAAMLIRSWRARHPSSGRSRAATCTSYAAARPAMRPLIVGAVHGLAGSGALMALVMTPAARHRCAGVVHVAVRSRFGGGDEHHLGGGRLAPGACSPADPPPRGYCSRWAGRRRSCSAFCGP